MTTRQLLSALSVSILLTGCGAAPTAKPIPEATASSPITYARAQCGGTPRGWAKQGAEAEELVEYNRVTVGPTGIAWNGAAIEALTLGAYLDPIRQMTPRPVTVLVLARDADCVRVESVRRIFNESADCREATARCVEYSESAWAKAHPPVPAPSHPAGRVR